METFFIHRISDRIGYEYEDAIGLFAPKLMTVCSLSHKPYLRKRIIAAMSTKREVRYVSC